jgi:ABC-type polysaccharide/polyol phosphate export permease
MNSSDHRITIVDLRIPFFRLVFFFVKVTLAMIPAAIILTLIMALVGGLIWATMVGHFPDIRKFIDMMARRISI